MTPLKLTLPASYLSLRLHESKLIHKFNENQNTRVTIFIDCNLQCKLNGERKWVLVVVEVLE